MKITVVGVLILIGGIVLLAIVLDRVNSNLNERKKAPEKKAEGNDQPNNLDN